MSTLHEWSGACAIGVAIRTDHANTPDVESRRYFLLNKKMSAEEFGIKIRHHWGIENSLHYVLDVTFGEDKCRIRTRYAARNLTTLRKQAMGIIKTGRLNGSSYRGTIKAAGWSHAALDKILCGWAQNHGEVKHN